MEMLVSPNIYPKRPVLHVLCEIPGENIRQVGPLWLCGLDARAKTPGAAIS